MLSQRTGSHTIELKYQQDQTNIPDCVSVETHSRTSSSPLLCLSVYQVMDDSSVNSVHLVRVWRSGKDIKKRVKERGGVGELERNGPYRAPPSTFGVETKITIQHSCRYCRATPVNPCTYLPVVLSQHVDMYMLTLVYIIYTYIFILYHLYYIQNTCSCVLYTTFFIEMYGEV